MVLPFFSPAVLIPLVAGPEGVKNREGAVLRQIQIRLPSLLNLRKLRNLRQFVKRQIAL